MMAAARRCDLNLLESKESCSICLEPYAGRNPKLLPCFHTFCVGCLSDLAQVSSTSSEGAGCATITCPACRKVSPVPAGGVASFQNNFYIDQDRARKKAAVASPCHLCDGGEESVHKCGRCGQFCQRCYRVHSKFCSSPVTPLLTSPASLEEKVESLTTTLAQYQQKNQALEQKNDVLTREVQSLKEKVSLVCQDLAMLQSHDHPKGRKDDNTKVLKDLTQQLQGLRQETSTNSRHLKDLQTSSTQLQASTRNLESSTRNLQTSTRNLETSSKAHNAELAEFKTHLAKSRTQAAFHVFLHANVRVRTKRVLILKQEIVNLGQCYNTNTGFFTAPVAGVYLFMATASTAEEKKSVELDLVHEGKTIAFLFTDQESCSCHMSVRMAQGDRVWLETFKPVDEGDYMPFQGGWRTSFTGVLVHPDY